MSDPARLEAEASQILAAHHPEQHQLVAPVRLLAVALWRVLVPQEQEQEQGRGQEEPAQQPTAPPQAQLPQQQQQQCECCAPQWHEQLCELQVQQL